MHKVLDWDTPTAPVVFYDDILTLEQKLLSIDEELYVRKYVNLRVFAYSVNGVTLMHLYLFRLELFRSVGEARRGIERKREEEERMGLQ